MSTLPPSHLPKSLKDEGVKAVCTVETVLDQCDMKRKNEKWYHLRKEYNQAEFDVKLLVGTGLRFEIWGQKGRRSRAHDEIEVEWEPADPVARESSNVEAAYGMYRV